MAAAGHERDIEIRTFEQTYTEVIGLETLLLMGWSAALATVGWVAVRYLSRAKMNRQMLRTVARERGGEVVRAQWCGGFTAHFQGLSEEVHIWLSPVPHGRHAALQLHVPWSTDGRWLSLAPRGALSRLALWNRRSGRIVRELDYRLGTSHSSWARRLIGGGVTTRLQQINALQKGGGSELWLTNGRLSLTFCVPAGATERLRQLVDNGLELADQLGLQDRGDIQMMGPVPDAEDDPKDCPVCREALAGRVVFCRACGTPHHRDCWRYVGKCSMFGCTGTRTRGRWNWLRRRPV